MSKEFLDDIIQNFDPSKFTGFFRDKNRNFVRKSESLDEYNTEKFSNFTKIGEIKFETDNLIVVHAKSHSDLTERTGKKLQYEIAKKILKTEMYDAGIFIYYDSNGSFRFSLVYASYIGKREWSTFKRFTYFVNPNLTNKTFKQRIGLLNFDSLKSIKDAFSVDKVTKEFYKDIANWYFWTVDNCKFPESAENIDNGRNIAVIRLITRIIFIWFMKELNLVPSNLFNKKYIESILLENSNDESAYYKAILQNLFFATLSTPKEQRRFTDETRHIKGHNDDFGNQNVFRFHEFYKNPEHIKSYFEDIPFLNGGLFECLDISRENQYVDGFTRRKQYQAHVPDYLFFSGEREANLNHWYDTKDKKYVVKGLLEILSAYNFTVDENTADDADIALDPELLGKVFENLLASFNPETSTTARKATGSFYTPREIVDYMVTESLKEYFRTHLKETTDIENKFESLFNHALDINPFIDGSRDTKNLVNLIENVRIVDPAVGSGAFPMGILNKLVFILNKIDKGNKLWKDAQLRSVENIQDSSLREETRGHIENYFQNKNPDYGRKLYLIQRCIYGVDIQQIAVEISKLRFFISLLVDEKIDKTKENWGIEPLPNLDFKIMQGNSLLEEYEGIKLFDESLFKSIDDNKEHQLKILRRKQKDLEKEVLKLNSENKYTNEAKKEYAKKLEDVSKKIEALLYNKKTKDNIFDIFDEQLETNQKRDTLNKLHKEFFDASRKEQKDKIKLEIEKLEWELIESTLISQGKKSKLDELNKIRKSNSKPFFLWKLHFADVFEKGGFDIVIGNPPYIRPHNLLNELKVALWKYYRPVFEAKSDLYACFMQKSIELLCRNGVNCFIVSKTWLSLESFQELRSYILTNTKIKLLSITPQKTFENATVETIVYIFERISNESKLKNNMILISEFVVDHFVPINKVNQDNFYQTHLNSFDLSLNNQIIEFNDKIKRQSKPLNECVKFSYGIKTGDDSKFIHDSKLTSHHKKLLRRSDFERYLITWKGEFVWYVPELMTKNKKTARPGESRRFEIPKIIVQDIGKCIVAAYDDEKYYVKDALLIHSNSSGPNLKYLLGILNSRLIGFIYSNTFKNLSVAKNAFLTLPIYYKTNCDKEDKKCLLISQKVDEILFLKKSTDYNYNSKKQSRVIECEEEINQLIYKLYNLTDEEINIIEKNG